MHLTDFIQSGRFDATLAESNLMLSRATRFAELGGCTEAKDLPTPKGWRRTGDESTPYFSDAWEVVASNVASIPTTKWKRGTSTRHSVEFAWVLLRHRISGKTMLRVVGHPPAHLWKPGQRRANVAAIHGLGRLVRGLARRLKPDHISVSCDFNRDLRWKRNRRLIADAMRGTGLHLVVPPKGTHHLRKIDGYLTTCRVVRVSMLARFKGFDHRGFKVVIRFT